MLQTTIDTSDCTEHQDSTARGAAVRRGRKVTLLALVASVLFGLVTFGSAAPASAAPAPMGTVCFKTSNSAYGQVFTGPYTANGSVQVQAYVNGIWRTVSYKDPNWNGCVTAPLVTGNYFRFAVYHRDGAYTYVGQSDWRYIAGIYTYNFGTVWLNSYRTS